MTNSNFRYGWPIGSVVWTLDFGQYPAESHDSEWWWQIDMSCISYWLFTIQQFFGPNQIQSICRRQAKCWKDNDFSFWKGRKHCEKKETILVNQHFLLFSQCFLKASFSGSLKVWIVWYRVNSLPNDLLYQTTKFQTSPNWKHLQKTI